MKKEPALVWIGDKINYLQKKKSGDEITVQSPDEKKHKAIFYRLLRGNNSFEGRLASEKQHVKIYTQFVVIEKEVNEVKDLMKKIGYDNKKRY